MFDVTADQKNNAENTTTENRTSERKYVPWPFYIAKNARNIVPAGLPTIIRFFKWFPRTFKWFLAHPIGVVTIFVIYNILLSTLNFFNWGQSGDKVSANMVDAIVSPFYGSLNRVGQNKIIVVTIDYRTLRMLNNPYWPLSYDNQIKIIERISTFAPKAIFLDFYYDQIQPEYRNAPKEITEEERLLLSLDIQQDDDEYTVKTPENIQNFVRRLTAIRDGHITGTRKKTGEEKPFLPILLGPVGNDIWLKDLKNFAEAPLFGESASVGLDITRGAAIGYPLRDQGGLKTAAFVLFEIYCHGTRGKAAERCGDFIPFGRADRDISIEWGLGQAPYNNKMLRIRATNQDSGLYSSCVTQNVFDRIFFFGRFLWQGLFLGLYDEQTLKDQRCIYHHTLDASALFSLSETDEQALSNREMEALFKDKIVLVGADVNYLADRIDTPVSGVIPGVYAHAMALDNLIEYGKDASHTPTALFGAMNVASLVNIFVIIILCSLCIMARMGYFFKVEEQKRKLRLFYISVFLSLLVGSWGFTFVIMDWPVYNFFKIILLFISLIVVLEKFHFAVDDVQQNNTEDNIENNQN